MPDVTLIDLSWQKIETARPFPLGCLSLIAALEEEGFVVDFRHYQLNKNENPQDISSMADYMARDSAGIICVSTMALFLPFAVLAAKKIKEKFPEKTIVFGGPGPSESTNELLKTFPFIDVIVRGEGELTLKELVKALQSGRPLGNIKGISFRTGKKVAHMPDRPRIANLDSLPIPAFEKINFKAFGQVGLESSRGCPYDCYFCSVNQFWGRVNSHKSASRVIEEVSRLEALGVKRFSFVDDTFVLDRERVEDFCRAYKKEGLDITWGCMGRVNLMDERLMEAMAAANCREIFFGIESGSNRVLGLVNKQFTIDQAEKAVFMAKKYFKVYSAFIYGFPFESMADFNKTLTTYFFWREKDIRCQIQKLIPYKSSVLYKKYNHELEFDPQHITDFNLTHRHADSGITQEVLDLAKEHPALFPSYYNFKTPDFKKKARMIFSFVNAIEQRIDKKRNETD